MTYGWMGCPFRFAFEPGFNSPTKVLVIAMKNNMSSPVNCLTVDTV